VKADEPLVELETDKVTLEVNAPAAGVLAEIAAKDGETVGRRRPARADRRRGGGRGPGSGKACAAAPAAAVSAPPRCRHDRPPAKIAADRGSTRIPLMGPASAAKC